MADENTANNLLEAINKLNDSTELICFSNDKYENIVSLNNSINNMDKMKEDLIKERKKLELLPMPNCVSEFEKSSLKNCESNCDKALLKLNNAIKELSRVKNLVEESNIKINLIDSQISNIIQDLTYINEEFKTPRLLIVVEDDNRKIDSIISRFCNAKEELNKLEKWGLDNLKSKNILITPLLIPMYKNIESLLLNINSFKSLLKEDINLFKQLNQQKNEITHNLNELFDSLKEIQAANDANKKSAQLTIIKNDAVQLQNKLKLFEEAVDHKPSKYILISESLELEMMKTNLCNLSNLLETEEHNIEQKLVVAFSNAKLQHEIKVIENGIEKSNKIKYDKNVTRDDLLTTITHLIQLKNNFDQIEKLLNSLNLDNNEVIDLKNKSVNQLSELSEESKTLRQSIQDQVDTLILFEDQEFNIRQKLNKLINGYENWNNFENKTSNEIQLTIDSAYNLLPEILELNEQLNIIGTLNKPNNQYNQLTQKHKKFINDLKASKENSLKNEKYQSDASNYTKHLEKIEKLLNEAEQRYLLAFTEEDINQLQQQYLHILDENIKLTKESPNYELEKRFKLAQECVLNLNNNTEAKHTNIIKQQEMIQHLQHQIKNNETIIEKILDQYKNSHSIQTAKNDIELLKPIRELVINMPLDEIQNKDLRETLHQNVKAIHLKADVCILYDYFI